MACELVDLDVVAEAEDVFPEESPHVDSQEPLPVEEAEEQDYMYPKSTNVFKLFRYASCLDWFMMIFGTLAAILNGILIPIRMLLYGQLFDVFVNQIFSFGNVFLLADGVVNCTAVFPITYYNLTVFQIAEILNQNLPADQQIETECHTLVTENSTYTTVIRGCDGGRSTLQCITNDQFISEMNTIIFYFIAIGGGTLLFTYIQIWFFQTASERQVHKIRLSFYRSILKQEIGWFDSVPTGEISNSLADAIHQIHEGIGYKLALLIQGLFALLASFLVGFFLAWRLTLVLFGFTPFFVLSVYIMAKLTAAYASSEQQQYASAGAVAEDVFSAIRTVKAFGGETKETERYHSKLVEAKNTGTKKGLSVGISLGVVYFIIFLMNATAFWFGAYLISESLVSSGNFFATLFAILLGAFYFGQAAPHFEALLSAAGAATVIYEIIKRKSLIDPTVDDGEVPEEFDSTIEFKNVMFSYPTRPAVPVLTNFSLKVEVGKTVALVGPSGCGKSTIVQLLQRFYDVKGGQVLVGGKDIRKLNLKWLRKHIGVVSQEPVLFDTTIAENIRYGNKDVTMEQIIAAAKDANAHDFISELPDGYETLVGGRGAQISGGQKQRVAIARALVRNPKILLLDEATSALDTASEVTVQQALDRASEGRTTIVIAHRLSTIKNADTIVSLKDGSMEEVGTHLELMNKEGLYYEMVNAQTYGVDKTYAAPLLDSPASPPPRRKKSLLKKQSSLFSVFVRRSKSVRQNSTQSESSPTHFRSSITFSPTPGRISRYQSQHDSRHQLGRLSQRSIARQLSSQDSYLEIPTRKQMKEWDKNIPEVSIIKVFSLSSSEWWKLLLGLSGSAIASLPWPLFAILLGEILTVFGSTANDRILATIHPWAAAMIGMGVAIGFGAFIKTLFFSVSGERITLNLRSKAFTAMVRQEVGWFDEERNSPGALTTKLEDDARLVEAATGAPLGTAFEALIGLIAGVIIGFVYNWPMSLLILATVPIVLVAGILEVYALARHTAQNSKYIEKAGEIAEESVNNIKTVASLGLEKSFYKQYKKEIDAPYKDAVCNSVFQGISTGVSKAISILLYALLFRFGAWQVTQSPTSIYFASFVEVIVAFYALIFAAVGISMAGSYAPHFKRARLAASRILCILNRQPKINVNSEEGVKLDKVDGVVEAQEITFHYPARPSVNVLKTVSLSIKQGQTLALVGASGSGKSTIVSLLERFYNSTSGSLKLDGTDIKEFNIKWLRTQMGLVSQEPVLFDATIAENIRYGALFREVTDEEVVQAAKAANIHKFVETLPKGYDTNVGDRGTQISGGQKQRIAIARALVRNPKILLLDEATSALDTESEKVVQEALDRAQEGRTSITIAHRLSTVYNADCIAVLSEGKVVEVGTHNELLAKKGVYYQLNRFQNNVGLRRSSSATVRKTIKRRPTSMRK